LKSQNLPRLFETREKKKPLEAVLDSNENFFCVRKTNQDGIFREITVATLVHIVPVPQADTVDKIEGEVKGTGAKLAQCRK